MSNPTRLNWRCLKLTLLPWVYPLLTSAFLWVHVRNVQKVALKCKAAIRMRTAWPSGTQLSTQQIIYNRLADFWGELRCCRKKTSDSFLHFLLDYMKQNYFRKHPKMLYQEIMMWLLQIIHTPCCDFYMTDIWYNTTILLSHPLYSAAGFVALALYALLTWLLPVAQWQKTIHIHPGIFYHFAPAWGHGGGLWYNSTLLSKMWVRLPL